MVKRKVLTTLIATPVSVLVILILFSGGWDDLLGLAFLTGVFSLGAFSHILVYGVLVTFLSDLLTKRIEGNSRIILALAIHLILAGLLGWWFPIFDFEVIKSSVNSGFVYALITGFCFWVIDELLRWAKLRRKVSNNVTS